MRCEDNKPSCLRAAQFIKSAITISSERNAIAQEPTYLSSHNSPKSSDGFSIKCSAKEHMTISMIVSSPPLLWLAVLLADECPWSELSGDVSGGLFGLGAPTGLDAISGSLPSAMSLKESG